jgi:hypothetical protein
VYHIVHKTGKKSTLKIQNVLMNPHMDFLFHVAAAAVAEILTVCILSFVSAKS